jgi:hypothetical protein
MFTLLYLHEKYIRHMTFLANVIEVLGVMPLETYWRIKSFIQELLHWGTFRRAKAAACTEHEGKFKITGDRRLHRNRI